jgi:hypothetical protein
MSYRLLTTDITGGAAMPIKKGTLDLYNQEFELITREIGRISTGTKTTDVWILWGCFPTITGGTTYAFTEGAILYQNVILRVPAVTITLGGGQVPVFNLVTGNITSAIADPVLFSDNNTYNVHQDFSGTITAATAGSGICNWSAAKYYNTDWLTIGGSRFEDAKARIYNGTLIFNGYMLWTTSPEPSFNTAIFSFNPILNNRNIITREIYLVEPGVGGSGGTLNYRDYLVIRCDSDFKVMDGSTGVYTSQNKFGTPGAKFDLTALNGAQMY